MICSACNGTLQEVRDNVMSCKTCAGVQGMVYRGDVGSFVNLNQMQANADSQNMRYFDFTVLNGDGSVNRVHGWFDRTTKNVGQFG